MYAGPSFLADGCSHQCVGAEGLPRYELLVGSARTDAHRDDDGQPHIHRDGNHDADTIGDRGGNVHLHSQRDAIAYAKRDARHTAKGFSALCCQACPANGNANGNAHANANGNGNAHANAHPDRHINTHANGNADHAALRRRC